MSSQHEKEQLAKLIELIQEALSRDTVLRQTYHVGEKFRFIRDRLQGLMEKIAKEGTVTGVNRLKDNTDLEKDELLVYIHLYNAQGVVLRTWQSMITPKAFFDFSVNRPIYQEKSFIEAFIRSKANKIQHAYLAIAIKRQAILPTAEAGLKDALGNPLVKVKEGSLRYERAVAFVHNNQDYILGEDGELIKKSNPSAAVNE